MEPRIRDWIHLDQKEKCVVKQTLFFYHGCTFFVGMLIAATPARADNGPPGGCTAASTG